MAMRTLSLHGQLGGACGRPCDTMCAHGILAGTCRLARDHACALVGMGTREVSVDAHMAADVHQSIEFGAANSHSWAFKPYNLDLTPLNLHL